MLLKLYAFLLLSSCTMQAVDQGMLMCPLPLKDLCAEVVARGVDIQLPRIDSHKSLKDAYAILETPMFKKFTEFPAIHALIAKSYQKLHSSELLVWSKTLQDHNGFVHHIGYSPDGTELVSSADDAIKILDLKSGTNTFGTCIKTLTGHNNWINVVAYSPNGNQLASGSWDNTVKIWDLESGTCTKTLIGHDKEVDSVAYSSNGSLLASGSWDNTVKIWDLVSGTCIQTLIGHNHCVQSVAYSQDGTQLVSGSMTGIIKIWDLESYTCIQTLEGSKYCPNFVAYSPNGLLLVSGSEDNTIKIWSLKSGANTSDVCIQALRGHQNRIRRCLQIY